MIARRARATAAPEQSDTGVNAVLRSAGRPLAAPVRQEMESRFGTDFSGVRLHTGPAAARSARAIGARAYTSGSHVVIGAGGGDKHTLAHELTHVVQQRDGPVSGTVTGHGFAVSDPGDRFELAAEANARRVLSGPVPQARTADGPAAARGPKRRVAGGEPAVPVQRYRDVSAQESDEMDLSEASSIAVDRISDNGLIAVAGRQEAYADAELFDRANRELAGQDRIRVRLEQGRQALIGGRQLYRVLPVLASREAADWPGAAHGHEPVLGDTPQTRADKLAAYKTSLTALPADHGDLLASALRLTGGTDTQAIDRLHQRLLALANREMGAQWAADQVPVDPRREPNFPQTAVKCLTQLAIDRDASREPEQVLTDLLITLPNDCQAAAERLIGKPSEGLAHPRATPAVGENHYVNLRNVAGGRWQNHFAAVIMRDGHDSLTYETAADSANPLSEGKSLGYFALYGAGGTQQSFDAEIGRQNTAPRG
ncbi:DUF4157 domain-containing protein [Streptomyces sp. GXMU-J5]|uniref:DUF4157 domain-containing protein n=2 Tax=Streptomyces beihaiensis TaxID=2984495 RepID=A0ABT3TR98_9ACTN|nr:DUF4157 domain-containing protein [Streptomyces beihaiensis]MCX3059541.1 DUF4157 domain-containing protein [Streptomyces beihaiensis]